MIKLEIGETPRILITRLSHIGDCLHTLPLLCALRQRYPRGRIIWVAERASVQLMAEHDALDELITLPRGWLKSPRQVLQLRKRLRRFGPHVSIDPQGLTKSSIIGRLSGSRQRIGYASPDGRELSPLLNNQLVHRTAAHVVDMYLELLKPLGIEKPAVEFRVPVDSAARENVDRWLESAGLDNPPAILNPGAGWASRLWPTDRYAEVARHLKQRHGVTSVVVWAGDQERQWAEDIVAHARGCARLGPQTTLKELAALLRQSKMFVGSDTGPLHLAAAVGTPCVSLHGTTPASQSCAYGPAHIAVQEYYHAGTSRERRRTTNDAMKAIDGPRVCRACDSLLEGRDLSGEAA